MRGGKRVLPYVVVCVLTSSCRLDAEDVREYRHAGFVYDAPSRWVALGDLRFLRTMNNQNLVEMANEVRRRVRDQVDSEAEEPI